MGLGWASPASRTRVGLPLCMPSGCPHIRSALALPGAARPTPQVEGSAPWAVPTADTRCKSRVAGTSH